MSKRAVINPRWLDSMLVKWGRTIPGARGWYSVCPMLQSGIPASKPSYEPWELLPRDFDDLTKAIDSLEHKYRCVIYMAYKPWTMPEMLSELAKYGVCQRTQQRWLHDAAARIESHMTSKVMEDYSDV